MRLTQLRYFLAVCKYGNFTLAAKEFFVSQPAVSTAIRELEEEYSVRLFDRNKKKQLQLTEEGIWLKTRAEFILSYVAATEEQLRIYSKNKRYLRVGVAPMVGMLSFFGIYNNFCMEHPDIHIDLLEAGSLQIRSWVEDGIVDMGVALLDGLEQEQFEKMKLFETELVFCVHKSHPLANRQEIDIPDLKNEKLILLKADSYQNQLLKEEFARQGQQIDVLMYSSQINSIFSMLSYGNCGAFLFRQLVEPNEAFRAISLAEPIRLSVGLFRRRNQVAYPAMQELISYVKKHS